MKRLKILMSAYACEPGKGSEPGVGWNLARAMAEHHDVWVITRANNKTSIEVEVKENPVPNLHFIYYDLPLWSRWWKRGGRGVQLYYYLWQVAIYFVLKRWHKVVGFELVHHITFVKYWAPSLLTLLPIPFVWGPVGGAESAPKKFWQDFSKQGQLYESLRSVARWLGEHDPLVRITARRSSLCLATTHETMARLYKLGAKRVKLMGESGLSSVDAQALMSLPQPCGQIIRFVSVGRLLHWKGFHLAIHAFAEAKLENSEFWIIGAGPERERLEILCQTLGITSNVHFFGELKRSQVLEQLAKCHVLVHPSLHDSGGWVCLEAMAAGKPVLCLNLGGPAIQVTDATGIRVSAINPVQVVSALSVALNRFAGDESLRVKMGTAGQKHIADNYQWEQKVLMLNELYKEAIDASS